MENTHTYDTKRKEHGKNKERAHNNDLDQKQAYYRAMCFMGIAGGVSDQSYASLDLKASCKGDSNQSFKGRTVVRKAVSTETFH